MVCFSLLECKLYKGRIFLFSPFLSVSFIGGFKHLEYNLAHIGTHKIFAEWINGQVKIAHQKYSLVIIYISDSTIRILMWYWVFFQLQGGNINTWVSREIFIFVVLFLWWHHVLKLSMTVQGSEWVPGILIINQWNFSSIPRGWFMATKWKTSWIDLSLQFP